MWWWLCFSSLNSQILIPHVSSWKGRYWSKSRGEIQIHTSVFIAPGFNFPQYVCLGRKEEVPGPPLKLNCWCSAVPKAIFYILSVFPHCAVVGNTQPLSNDTRGFLMQPGRPLHFPPGDLGLCRELVPLVWVSEHKGWQSSELLAPLAAVRGNAMPSAFNNVLNWFLLEKHL